LYWKLNFEQALQLIDDLHEENPGFMETQKVKPKLSKNNTVVTQVHGSMKAINVLTIVKEIKSKNDEKAKQKEDAAKKKNEIKEAFVLCKIRCVLYCNERNCKAFGWKQCSICHKSV